MAQQAQPTARKQGIKTTITEDGTLVFHVGPTRKVEFNPMSANEEMRRNAMYAGFTRVISNVAAGEVQKGDFESIAEEMERRIRGIKSGLWSIKSGGFGFADHVEAVVRISRKAGKAMLHADVERMLLAKTTEERAQHAAIPIVRRMISVVREERISRSIDADESGLAALDALE